MRPCVPENGFPEHFPLRIRNTFLDIKDGGLRMSVVGGRTVCLLVAVGPVAMTFQRTPHSISTYTSIQIQVWFQMKEAPIHENGTSYIVAPEIRSADLIAVHPNGVSHRNPHEERHLDQPGSAVNITFGQIQGFRPGQCQCVVNFQNRPTRPVHSGIFWILLIKMQRNHRF